jgi:hypothetical protein
MRRVIVVIVLAVALPLLLGVLHCTALKPDHPPVISSIGGTASLPAGYQGNFCCNATDPDGYRLSYAWSCDHGSFDSDSGVSVNWTAPSTSGYDTITVVVTNEHGASDSMSRVVQVTPVTATIVDWDGVVAAYDFKAWMTQIDSGYRVYGSFSVDSLDINFLILDGANYDKLLHGKQYSTEFDCSHLPRDSFSLVIPVSGTQYFILDNTYSPADKSGHVQAQTVSP